MSQEFSTEFLVEWVWPEPDREERSSKIGVSDDTLRFAIEFEFGSAARQVGNRIAVARSHVFVERVERRDGRLEVFERRSIASTLREIPSTVAFANSSADIDQKYSISRRRAFSPSISSE
jgi:hypothetical protein